MLRSLFVLAAALPIAALATQPAVYTYESDASGFNTKNYFYDTGTQVVAFDTQFTPALAESSLKFLRTKTQNPVTYVVITHPNPDKFNGISVFKKEGAVVISSAATYDALPGVHAYKKAFFVQTAKMFTEATYPKLELPDAVFQGSSKLIEGVELKELSKPGVSSTQTVAYLPEVESVVVGDLIHHGTHAWLEGGIVNGKAAPDLEGWQDDLDELDSLYPASTRVLAGRGAEVELRTAVIHQHLYLMLADLLVGQYLRDLGPNAKSELQGPSAGAHYARLRALFENRLPNYGLSYLIEYGIYGLVSSKL